MIIYLTIKFNNLYLTLVIPIEFLKGKYNSCKDELNCLKLLINTIKLQTQESVRVSSLVQIIIFKDRKAIRHYSFSS